MNFKFCLTGSYVNPGVNYSSYSAAQSGTAMVGQSGIFSEQAACRRRRF